MLQLSLPQKEIFRARVCLLPLINMFKATWLFLKCGKRPWIPLTFNIQINGGTKHSMAKLFHDWSIFLSFLCKHHVQRESFFCSLHVSILFSCSVVTWTNSTQGKFTQGPQLLALEEPRCHRLLTFTFVWLARLTFLHIYVNLSDGSPWFHGYSCRNLWTPHNIS